MILYLKNKDQTYKALNGAVLQLKSKYAPGGIKVNYNKKLGDSLNPLELLDWYANWLDNRRPQLELNMKDTNLYPEQTMWQQLRDMRLHYQSGRMTLNEEIYRQLNNASSSSYRYFDDEDKHSGAYGIYLPNENNKIDIYSKAPNVKSTILHELTHSANRPNVDENGSYTENSATSPQEKKILQLGITTDKNLYKMLLKYLPENTEDIINYDNYLSVPSEIYARMMQFRKENNLDPKKNYTEKEIRDLMLKSNVEGIKYYKPEDFTKLLNEVAYNDTTNENIYYAKNGGKMNVIDQFKEGHKIHIKKKNRGKFTAYCGGNVTSACIARAKTSGNPTLVKRATFAANARKWKHQLGGILGKISDAYLKLSDSPIASTIYDTVNAGLYLAAPFTGGATLVPAMAMTGLLAGGATANAIKKGLNVLNGLDIASAIPGFGLTEKAVKASMKPVMRMMGKTTKKISRATKYRPINDKILVTTPDGRTFNFGKYRPTYWQMASWDKKYAPYAALVYGEDALNHGLNAYQVVKDVKQHRKGGKLCLIPRN